MTYKSNVYTPKLLHSYTPFNLRKLNSSLFTLHSLSRFMNSSRVFA